MTLLQLDSMAWFAMVLDLIGSHSAHRLKAIELELNREINIEISPGALTLSITNDDN